MSLLPWPMLLSQAVSLGIGPQCFWELSIAEWRALVGSNRGTQASMNRADLTHLSLRFPDMEIPLDDVNEE
jgi:uncharacterized phage protein (TIGR02216 family)